MKKRIGIITSGGDCAGLNAAIRAIVQCAKSKYGWDVIGIRNGTHGLMNDSLDYRNLDPTVDTMNHVLLRSGGTILGTRTKRNPFATIQADGQIVDRSHEIIENYHALKLDALIMTGGDGSLKLMNQFMTRGGINLVAIPKTIDNDIGLTEALGFETAVSIATEALDRLQPTAASHGRVMVLELMGRDAGHIALSAGVAGGADVILIPEIPFDLASITQKIRQVQTTGRNYVLIVAAESAAPKGGHSFMVQYTDGAMRYGGVGNYLTTELSKVLDIESRVNILGHVQRGAEPVARDRILAAAFGVRAVELVAENKFGRMVAWQNKELTDVAIEDAISSYQNVDLAGTMIRTVRGLDICLGD